ncbi:MAG: bifunctional folylpolyglutamate synthase/dihydrofolate synthase [Bacteroidales bacterium]|nr:bifunctional folylpolyglutamate synthase/dihydrofolate synthase [Bacteroidales bacterium]
MKKEFSDIEYQQIIAALFTRFPSFQKQGASAYKPGLEHSFEICRRMGQPQNAYPCIHVAGTNGKGSTCNMLAAQFAAKGLKVGLYTSPHILDFRERMRVVSADGARLASREKIWELIQEYDADFTALDLSFFEITTALAFKFFADEKVDIAIIETGLGGRLDATNVITPILSVITNIGLDHTDLLGGTLPLIAAEKAGIIKPGIPVVIGESHPETDPVFIRIAASNNAPITFADKMGFSSEGQASLGPSAFGLSPSHPSILSVDKQACPGQSLGLGPSPCICPGVDRVPAEDAPSSTIKPILERMDLRGSYQEKNLRTVMAAMAVLGREIDWPAIENAARICDFHGRWEVLATQPYTICDIGHNQHGLKYNFAQLESMLDSGGYSDLVMVYGSVADKDVDAVLDIIPQRAHVFFAAADNHRAMPAEELLRRAARPSAKACSSVASAVEEAIRYCKSLKNPILYIGGSTYLVSEAKVLYI